MRRVLLPHRMPEDPPPAGGVLRDFAGRSMGTSWSVRVVLAPGQEGAHLQQGLQRQLDAVVAEMSHWEADSDLARFNRAPAGNWMALPPDFATVIAAGLEVAEKSGGAFDPAMGALVDLWGFGPVPVADPPGEAEILEALALSGWKRLDFDPGARRLRQPGGLRLDLSGIAKGYAIDAVADLLRARGVAHFLLEIGGELIGRGVKPDGEPWWVDLENPAPQLPPFRVALHEIAVATSGTYVRGDHNLDPATGRPAARHILSASVLHASAMHADAWASALTVLGPETGLTLAVREALAARMVVRDASGVREVISPALAALL